ncbi:MAG: MFS transporter [Sinomonas sp.]|nr:MFS transporter [Sinomonas sp.]
MRNNHAPGITAVVMFVLLGAHVGVWGASLPWVATEGNLDPVQIGIALAVVALVSIVTSLWAGRAIDLRGRRAVLVAGLAAMSLAFLSFGFLPLGPLLGKVSFVFLGIAIGLLDVAVNTIGSDFEKTLDKQLMVGLHAGFSGGAAAGAGLVAAFTGVGAAPQTVLVGVGVLFAAAAVSAAHLPLPVHVLDAEVSLAAECARRPRIGLLAGIVAVGTVCFFGDGLMENFSPLFFADRLQTTATVTALAVSAFHACSFIGRVVLGIALMRTRRDIPIILTSAILAAGAVTILIVPATGVPAAVIGMGITGFVLAPLIPTAYSYLGRRGGSAAGRSISLLTSASYAAFTLAPAAGGLIASAFGTQGSMLLAGLSYTAGAVLSAVLIATTFRSSRHPSNEAWRETADDTL